MESIIKDNMFAHLVDNNLLDKNQHGFLPCHSIISQLLERLYDWSRENDVGYPVDVVYIDFSKASDTVSHCKLVSELKSFNLFHKTIDWISSFLLNRTQAIKCNRNISRSSHVTSGVPQGSVIVPLLYTCLLMTYLVFATLVLLKCMQMILRYIILYGTNQMDQYLISLSK